MSPLTRRAILFGAPLLVGITNLFHPIHFEPTGIYQAIEPVTARWITIHLLNIAGFSLLGLAGLLLVRDRPGKAAAIARLGFTIFIPVYIAFDSLAGIGTGILVQYAKGISSGQIAAVLAAIDAYWGSQITYALAALGSMLWTISLVAVAVSFSEPGRQKQLIGLGVITGIVTGWGASASSFGSLPWWVAVTLIGLATLLVARPVWSSATLILSSILFGTTHVVPYGPLAMLCLLFATAILEFKPAARLQEQGIAPI